MFVDGLGDTFERVVIRDVVGRVDDGIVLGHIAFEYGTVGDDAIPFGCIGQRIDVAVKLVGIALAVVVEPLVGIGVLKGSRCLRKAAKVSYPVMANMSGARLFPSSDRRVVL